MCYLRIDSLIHGVLPLGGVEDDFFAWGWGFIVAGFIF